MTEQREPYHVASGRGGNHSVAHTQLVSAAKSYLLWRGAYVYKVWGGPMSKPGAPDIFAVLQGRALAIEVKTGAAVLSSVQERERADLERAGALYLVVHDIDALEDALVAAGLTTRAIKRGWER